MRQSVNARPVVAFPVSAKEVFVILAFADWCSYYVALLGGFDPTPVPLVESFKQELSRS